MNTKGNVKTEWIDNECNYSHKWQQYQAEYDKYEYDIKLLDGTVVENCYPNGGIFHSISDKHNKQGFDESDIDQIRFSKNPKYGINPDDTDGGE